MNDRSTALFGRGKSYEYPSSNLFLYNVLGIPLTIGMIGLGIYALLVETKKFFPDGVYVILGISVAALLLGGLIFNYYHTGIIIVNDHEITSLKPKKPVSIPWTDIDVIYYTMGRGGLPGDPHFTVYIFSKSKDFIVVQREINGIGELMNMIRQYAKPNRTEYIPFRGVVRLFLGLYFPRLTNRRIRD